MNDDIWVSVNGEEPITFQEFDRINTEPDVYPPSPCVGGACDTEIKRVPPPKIQETIKNFKIFEATLKKSKNPVKWKGKPFWIGIVDLRDGEIIVTWTYQTAKSCDFHHTFYMDREYREKIDNDEYGIFWFNEPDDLDFWDISGISDKVYTRIMQQVQEN